MSTTRRSCMSAILDENAAEILIGEAAEVLDAH